MFEQKRLCGDGAYAARAEQLCAGDQQVDGEDDEIAHRANGTIATSGGKTAQRGRIASHYEFAPHSRKALSARSGRRWSRWNHCVNDTMVGRAHRG
jgi:hypothetical protein